MKLTLEHGLTATRSYVATVESFAQVRDATDFQYQAFSSLDKRDNHVAITVEVREKSPQSTIKVVTCVAD